MTVTRKIHRRHCSPMFLAGYYYFTNCPHNILCWPNKIPIDILRSLVLFFFFQIPADDGEFTISDNVLNIVNIYGLCQKFVVVVSTPIDYHFVK